MNTSNIDTQIQSHDIDGQKYDLRMLSMLPGEDLLIPGFSGYYERPVRDAPLACLYKGRQCTFRVCDRLVEDVLGDTSVCFIQVHQIYANFPACSIQITYLAIVSTGNPACGASRFLGIVLPLEAKRLQPSTAATLHPRLLSLFLVYHSKNRHILCTTWMHKLPPRLPNSDVQVCFLHPIRRLPYPE